MEETGLRLERVTKRFDDVVAVDAFDLEVTEGEFVTLLGPSGCGKTTVLRVVAGFEDPDEGRVRFRGEDVTRRTPQRRGFGMVFQNYALFPHLDVHENVAFGLRARGASRATIEGRVRASLRRVNLEGLGERPVQALSGGQQQRVALARALAIEPPLLLLDEPLSNLDAALRERTRTELRLLVKDLGITAVFVTHDQEEAFALSDRIAVLSAGRLRQEGTPEELYRRPVDRFVATFVGRANLLPGRIRRDAGEPAVELAPGARWPVAGDSGGKPPGWEDGAPVEALLRPEDLELADDGPYRGVVHDRRFAGPITSYRVRLEGGGEVEVAGGHGGAAQGAPVAVRPRAGLRLRVFPAEGTTRPHEVGPSDVEPIGSEP